MRDSVSIRVVVPSHGGCSVVLIIDAMFMQACAVLRSV